MEENNNLKYPILTYLFAAIFFLGIFCTVFYCMTTIYKGIIRQAVVEAIEQTRVKL